MSRIPKTYVGFSFGSKTPNVTLECFFDIHCPFSKKAYTTLRSYSKNDDKVLIKMIPYIQPWHPQGFFICKAATVAGMLGGDESYFKMVDHLYENFDEYVDSKVADYSPNDWKNKMKELAVKIDLKKDEFENVYMSDEAVTQVKILQKYGRQNSIHVTPTIAVNGLIDNSISSSWKEEDWKNYLNQIYSK
eukprot:gene10977-3684_t